MTIVISLESYTEYEEEVTARSKESAVFDPEDYDYNIMSVT